MTAIHASVWLSNASELCITSFNGCNNARTEISKCYWQKAANSALEKLTSSSWILAPPTSPHFYPLHVHSVLWPCRKRILLTEFLKAILNLNHYNMMCFRHSSPHFQHLALLMVKTGLNLRGASTYSWILLWWKWGQPLKTCQAKMMSHEVKRSLK